MNATKTTKIIHWAIFFCLTLPFYYTGCTKTKVNKEDIAQIDSANKAISIDSAKAETVQNHQEDTLASTPIFEKQDSTLSEKIATNHTWTKPLINPKKDTYSGIGTIINTVQLVPFTGTFTYFFLLVISLLIRHTDKNAIVSMVILDIAGLIFLFGGHSYDFVSQKLWGFWISATLLTLLTLLDVFLLWRRTKISVKETTL